MSTSNQGKACIKVWKFECSNKLKVNDPVNNQIEDGEIIDKRPRQLQINTVFIGAYKRQAC